MQKSSNSAIVPYANAGSRASRVGTSPHTQTLRRRVEATFGVNVNDFGNLTPDMVRNMSISAQVAKEQLEMLAIYVQAAKERGAAEAEVEKMRADFLKDAEGTLKTLDKFFQGAVLLNAKHEQHMKLIGAKTAGQLQEIRQGGEQDLTAYQRELADRLKASRQVHQFQVRAGSQEIAAGTQMQIQQLRDRPLQLQSAQRERADWLGFLTGKPKAQLPASKQNFGGWFS